MNPCAHCDQEAHIVRPEGTSHGICAMHAAIEINAARREAIEDEIAVTEQQLQMRLEAQQLSKTFMRRYGLQTARWREVVEAQVEQQQGEQIEREIAECEQRVRRKFVAERFEARVREGRALPVKWEPAGGRRADQVIFSAGMLLAAFGLGFVMFAWVAEWRAEAAWVAQWWYGGAL